MYCKCVYSDCLPSCVSHCMLMRLNETLALATSLVCAYAYTYVRVSCTYVRTTALRCTYVDCLPCPLCVQESECLKEVPVSEMIDVKQVVDVST